MQEPKKSFFSLRNAGGSSSMGNFESLEAIKQSINDNISKFEYEQKKQEYKKTNFFEKNTFLQENPKTAKKEKLFSFQLDSNRKKSSLDAI